MSDIPTTQYQMPPAPPLDDDEEPAFRPRPRRRAHALTFALAGVAILAAGFLVGVLVQKHDDHGRIANAATTGASGRGGRNFANGGRFNGGSGGGFQGRTVKLVDGNNVYLTDANGNITKVVTNAASAISKAQSATVKAIAPGDTVFVVGTQNPDGSMTASSFIDFGATSPFGSFGGFGGGGAAGANGVGGNAAAGG
jgi:hypothetical protein